MIGRAKLWISRCVKQQALSLAILLLMFASLVYGVADAVQGIERGLLWPFVWIGLLLGWGLACSRSPAWLAVTVSLVAGVTLVLLHVGQLGSSLAAIVGASTDLVWGMIQGNLPPDLAPLETAVMELANSIYILGSRLSTWLLNLIQGRPQFDPVAIAFPWSLALWGTVIWACWAVRRRAQPLSGAAPAVALLAATLANVGGRAWYLLPLLASVLMLKTLEANTAHGRQWERKGLKVSPRVRADTTWMALGLSLALVVVAGLFPSISVYRIIDLADNLSREPVDGQELARSLGLEPETGLQDVELSILDARRSSGLPTRQLIGSGPELSEQVAMFVSIDPAQPDAAQPLDAAGAKDPAVARYYWRGLTYDRYTERGWSAVYTVRVRYTAGEPASETFPANRRFLRQEIRLVEDGGGLLYVTGALITVDQDFQVAWRMRPGPQQPGDVFGATTETNSYRADSLLPVFAEAELRAAGQEYPAWVAERYLVLPDSVPDRVLALARDLTATEPTPYDRAVAIERYLRRFPYTLDVPAPPAGQDIADYFLFDLQQGYCDYYATAMVVLARAAGMPARLVTGYAPGSYDEVAAQFIVTEAEAHSWAEIYFPGYGWIEFEPTAGRPPITRPVDVPPEIPAEQLIPLEPITAPQARVNWALWLGAAGGILALILGGLLLWWVADTWRLRRLAAGVAVVDIHRRLYRYGRWLGASAGRGDTPREFAASLAVRLTDLARDHRWDGQLDAAAEEIGWLTELCNRSLYSPDRPRSGERAQAIRTWNLLRLRLWLARALVRIPRTEQAH
jgi:transglutaminase-like putative cysteine protease